MSQGFDNARFQDDECEPLPIQSLIRNNIPILVIYPS